MFNDEQTKRIIKLVDMAYFLNKTLRQQPNLSMQETLALKAWIDAYELLQAEITKENTEITLH